MKFFFIGDSWASKAFTKDNHHDWESNANDVRLSDFWNLDYEFCSLGGKGNLACLDYLVEKNLPQDLPIVWIYTEPGRDYGRITGNNEHKWLLKEEVFEVRKKLNQTILEEIRNRLPNPIALIGGLSDVEDANDFTVIHPSWQQWIAKQIKFDKFKFGWGAPDVTWRMKNNKITRPSKQITYACIDWMKFNKEAELQDYMYMYHPGIKATVEFGKYLCPQINDWIEKQ
jgi:hypothetical protein